MAWLNADCEGSIQLNYYHRFFLTNGKIGKRTEAKASANNDEQICRVGVPGIVFE